MKYTINNNKITFMFTGAEAKLINASIHYIRELRNVKTIKQMRVATNLIKAKKYEEFDNLMYTLNESDLHKRFLIEEDIIKNKCLETSLEEDWLELLIEIVAAIELGEKRRKLFKEIIKLIKEDVNPNCSQVKQQEYIDRCKQENKLKTY